MFVSLKKHTKLEKLLEDTKEAHELEKKQLKERISQNETLARFLERIADKFGDNLFSASNIPFIDSSGNIPGLELDDSVAVYVDDDHLGGKVIKQETIKLIRISRDGLVTEGVTGAAPSKGRKYLLVQE